MISSLKLSQKVNIVFGGIILISILTLTLISFFLFSSFITQSKISELKEQTRLVSGDLELIIEAAIKSNLHGISEQSYEFIKDHHEQYLAGDLTYDEMMGSIRRMIFSQKIGTTGYTSTFNYDGVLNIHPKSEGVNISGVDFWP
jgi:sensor domain CHASE-containing protein